MRSAILVAALLFNFAQVTMGQEQESCSSIIYGSGFHHMLIDNTVDLNSKKKLRGFGQYYTYEGLSDIHLDNDANGNAPLRQAYRDEFTSNNGYYKSCEQPGPISVTGWGETPETQDTNFAKLTLKECMQVASREAGLEILLPSNYASMGGHYQSTSLEQYGGKASAYRVSVINVEGAPEGCFYENFESSPDQTKPVVVFFYNEYVYANDELFDENGNMLTLKGFEEGATYNDATNDILSSLGISDPRASKDAHNLICKIDRCDFKTPKFLKDFSLTVDGTTQGYFSTGSSVLIQNIYDFENPRKNTAAAAVWLPALVGFTQLTGTNSADRHIKSCDETCSFPDPIFPTSGEYKKNEENAIVFTDFRAGYWSFTGENWFPDGSDHIRVDQSCCIDNCFEDYDCSAGSDAKIDNAAEVSLFLVNTEDNLQDPEETCCMGLCSAFDCASAGVALEVDLIQKGDAEFSYGAGIEECCTMTCAAAVNNGFTCPTGTYYGEGSGPLLDEEENALDDPQSSFELSCCYPTTCELLFSQDGVALCDNNEFWVTEFNGPVNGVTPDPPINVEGVSLHLQSYLGVMDTFPDTIGEREDLFAECCSNTVSDQADSILCSDNSVECPSGFTKTQVSGALGSIVSPEDNCCIPNTETDCTIWSELGGFCADNDWTRVITLATYDQALSGTIEEQCCEQHFCQGVTCVSTDGQEITAAVANNVLTGQYEDGEYFVTDGAFVIGSAQKLCCGLPYEVEDVQKFITSFTFEAIRADVELGQGCPLPPISTLEGELTADDFAEIQAALDADATSTVNSDCNFA